MNLNRIRASILTLIFGLVVLFGGVQSIVLAWQKPQISDAEVILRARALGMVELKEALDPEKGNAGEENSPKQP